MNVALRDYMSVGCVPAQVTDGASAVLMASRRAAIAHGLPILGVFRSFAAIGVDPEIMGIGPAVAIPLAVEKAGLTLADIDLFELNEAFASQVCIT
jgi:acetyl-CoA acetyltransferase